jgi:hypothetical protein
MGPAARDIHDEVTIVAAELDPSPVPLECSCGGPVVGGCAADCGAAICAVWLRCKLRCNPAVTHT